MVQGFAKSRGWRGRYIFLSGYCDLLVNGSNILKRPDLEDLQKIASTTTNTVAERVRALFTRGLASWSMSDRGEAARMYRRAIAMASNASTQDRSVPVITTGYGPGGMACYRQGAGKLIDYYAKISRENLDILTGAANREIDPGVDNPVCKQTMWPVGANSVAERDAQHRQLDNAMRMRSEDCAQCAKKREDVALRTCTRCGLVWYCGAECQRRHWKAVHRRQCREPKDFRAGDIVRLSGLDTANSVAQRDAQHRQLDNAMRMRSEDCAQCAKKREDVALRTCTRCGLVWYCGAECQRRHWKAVHRRQCREPKDFRAGDIVRLSGLDTTNKELEDHFVVVIDKDAAAADSWKVAHDQLLPTVGKVVQASQMQRMLTE